MNIYSAAVYPTFKHRRGRFRHDLRLLFSADSRFSACKKQLWCWLSSIAWMWWSDGVPLGGWQNIPKFSWQNQQPIYSLFMFMVFYGGVLKHVFFFLWWFQVFNRPTSLENWDDGPFFSEESVDFVESLLRRQLSACLGRSLTAADVANYMRFHHR